MTRRFAPHSDRRRVLVVDDERGPREALRMVLAPEHEVITAASAARAIEVLNGGAVDVVTLDLHRPGSDGPALLSRIRSQWPDAQVIVITGHGDLASAVHGLRHGIADYLPKPFDVAEVADAVRRALARRPRATAAERRGGELAFLIGLAEMAELQDGLAIGHGRRVACYAVALAERVGMSEAECQQLWLAGMIHDLGKLAVPAELLSQPRLLHGDERAFIERHTVLGERLLAPLGLSPRVCDVVRHHHEWWNGAGHPDGLSRDSIPFEARIVTLADAWDAMSSDRPYREALAKQAAIDEIAILAGRQFDPDLAKEMIALVEGDGIEHEIALAAVESVSKSEHAPSAWSPNLEDSRCRHSESSSRSISGGV